MSKFEQKKKMLAAESEVYRQLLKLELQTFKVYGVRTRRRLASAQTYLPILISAWPLMKGMFRGGRRKKSGFSLGRMGSLLMLGWKTYQRFSPLFGHRKFSSLKREPEESAAEEYLSNRL